MKYEPYLIDGYRLRDLFEVIRKLNILNNGCYVSWFMDDEYTEHGCRCGYCRTTMYGLEIELGHDDVTYSDDREYIYE